MRKNLYLIILLLLAFPFIVNATHLRAGEITAKRVSPTQLTYKVTLTTYTDQINGRAANDGQETVNFYFGFSTNKVETFTVSRKKKSLISPSTMCNVYDTTFTFPAAGRYTISCGIVNRNERTINLPQPSENISFFVQTTIVINASFGLNSTPVLLNIPLDSAALGKKFIHNPGAFDIDGDSLSYKLTTPQRDKGVDTGIGEFIDGYKDPTSIGPSPVLNQAGTGPATFKIDPRTGDLIWDAPREIGQYNVAFIIEEWRKAPDGSYIKIGEIVRDMQIIVVESDNNPPELILPPDICIEAGKKLEFDVKATDLDDQPLKITSAGGVYNLDANGNFFQYIEPEAASFKSLVTKKQAVGTFTWNTNCLHVRDQAYDVLFKVEDNPGRFDIQLVDIKTIKVNVIPPRPVGLVAKETDNGIALNWIPQKVCKTAGKILIYRKSGCSGLNPGECLTGMPADWSYSIIGEVSISDSTFIDTKADKGSIYSYRLITELAVNDFLNMQSAPSSEFCIGAEITTGMNVMTKVSITKTDLTKGTAEVAWTRPLDFVAEENPGPYVYKLYRAVGIGGESYELIHTITTLLDNSADTTFTDSNLNTEELVYRYKVEFYTGTSILYSTSSVASSVRLKILPDNKSLDLTWEANVPWDNTNKQHYIYREDKLSPGNFNLVKKVDVTSNNTFEYLDNGLDEEPSDGDISYDIQNGETHCYYVITYGTYPDLQQFGILENYSQIACGSPSDKTPPCPPSAIGTPDGSGSGCEGLSSEDFCNDNVFVNKINWGTPTVSGTEACRKDIVSYNIYYARYEDQEPALIAVQDASLGTTFNHRRNSKDGFAGCYYISAKNSLGIDSDKSNKICFDNCEDLGFPNVFSPNNDGKNDTFSPLNCPAFINNISFDLYSSQGLKVATSTGERLEWDGKDLKGKDLPAGVYYYYINVTFEKLDRAGTTKSYKGYLTLIR
ncbi:gliding motility-associated C-terminal domain-containing protein [Lacihabitans sp. LS3-19]|uniref:T9SS type B sorting domain-containing protein n=1 Tax=Lacihabitans sp. LS3-19 TaxID=2487335 RepID=UPI0020CD2A7C|nr:gliding motility-associated C-terminal domain-containing protein [Lacihabitans sp. LS3-19]MCP9766459.1 gliding motility-associated C-terminal domain-containing protein [Lacihabitans sp. LS3-19]